MKKIIVILTSIFLILILVLNFNLFIKSQQWKYSKGGYIGDFISFDHITYNLVGQHIYKNNKLVGKVIICLGTTLLIREFETSTIGYYSKK